jgi:hypothetical protein
MTMHRNKFLYNKTNQMHQFHKVYFVMKLYKFRRVPLSIIRSFIHCTLCSILVLLESCMTYTIVELQ